MANAVAIKTRKGQLNAKAPAEFATMGTVRCEGCGEEFLITQHPATSSSTTAARQAHEHERDKKHPDRIEFPE